MTKLTAATENARTLAAALGVAEDDAAELLKASILVTSSSEESAVAVGSEAVEILSRTFSDVGTNTIDAPAVEIVIGATAARSNSATVIWVSCDGDCVRISRVRPNRARFAQVHGSLRVVVACYASSAAAAAALPGLASPPETVEFRFSDLALPDGMWTEPVEFNDTYLAGAGAVGNGFIWTLRHFDVRGALDVVDPDDVSSGNLNRQIWFDEDDVEKPKAERLVLHATPFFPRLKLTPRKAELQQLKTETNPRWLKRLIVGVDSRRVRRHLQSELPREVYDASTTGINEVVLHFNRQPACLACLGCIYHETPRERAREEHVAEALGVTAADVATGRIDPSAAAQIARRYGLEATVIEGLAYDSLFKELCSQKALMVEGQQVLAPFAFVSVLAGALLAIEMVARLIDPSRFERFNYWRVSPWHPFRVLQWRLRGRNDCCEICGDPHVDAVSKELWDG
jgi:hypothetical protein